MDEGFFTVGSAGRAALQGSILQAVQHYKGYGNLFIVGSAQCILDQPSLWRPRQDALIVDARCLGFAAPMPGNQSYSD